MLMYFLLKTLHSSASVTRIRSILRCHTRTTSNLDNVDCEVTKMFLEGLIFCSVPAITEAQGLKTAKLLKGKQKEI